MQWFIFVWFLIGISGAGECLVPQDISINPCAINRHDKRRGELAIAAVFRDEGDWLKEWIEYHRLVGVSHFYLYNNCSSDQFWSILKPYVDKGIVELFDVPFDSYVFQDGAVTHNLVQVTCYNHALSLARSDWLAVIDLDEFICPVVDADIPAALKRYHYAAGIMVYWQIYGTAGVGDLEPDELLIEKLMFKMPNGKSGLFKSIIRPKGAICLDPHYCVTSKGITVAPDHRMFSHHLQFEQLPIDVLRINHYTYRTESYYYNVKSQRRARWGDCPSHEEQKERLESANQEYDPVMQRFIPALRKRMRLS